MTETENGLRITTIKDLKRAVKKANEVLVQIRFTTSEDWVKISKKEMMYFLRNYEDDQTAEEAGEMSFAFWHNGDLYVRA